jgi:enoyl-CoA hydratase/carnithine racemase
MKRALEIVIPGENVSAQDARTMGLVNQVFPLVRFDADFEGYAKKFEVMSGSALKSTKKAFKKAVGFEFERNLGVAEKIYMKELMALEDAHEGSTSFLENRKPVWKHK